MVGVGGPGVAVTTTTIMVGSGVLTTIGFCARRMISITLTVARASTSTATNIPNELRGGNPNTQVVTSISNNERPSLLKPIKINGKLLTAKSPATD